MTRTKLTVKKEDVKKYKEGDVVKLNNCEEKVGRIITITNDKIVAISDNGCYDFWIV